MKNQEFRIDTEAGVVVFSQKAHDKMFVSKSKANSPSEFNIGIGQLIAMKRNEIEIRKVDIQSMLDVIKECENKLKDAHGTAKKLWTNFIQLANDKVKMSQNHIRELKKDLDTLYKGTYTVKPYAEILEDHRVLRKGTEEEKTEIREKSYAVPSEIIDGTHIFEVENGSVTIKRI